MISNEYIKDKRYSGSNCNSFVLPLKGPETRREYLICMNQVADVLCFLHPRHELHPALFSAVKHTLKVFSNTRSTTVLITFKKKKQKKSYVSTIFYILHLQ